MTRQESKNRRLHRPSGEQSKQIRLENIIEIRSMARISRCIVCGGKFLGKRGQQLSTHHFLCKECHDKRLNDPFGWDILLMRRKDVIKWDKLLIPSGFTTSMVDNILEWM